MRNNGFCAFLWSLRILHEKDVSRSQRSCHIPDTVGIPHMICLYAMLGGLSHQYILQDLLEGVIPTSTLVTISDT
jgi:hypothetical protein